MYGVVILALFLVVSNASACKKTIGGHCCYLPFEYHGVTYNDCTTKDNGKPWCYLNKDRTDWDVCEVIEGPTPCEEEIAKLENLKEEIKEKEGKIAESEEKLEECKAKIPAPRSCADIYKNGERRDGEYTIEPDSQGPFKVWCDMTTDKGGWTVFQRRMDGKQNFYRGWSDYKKGFGDLAGEFWLGLDKIHRLTEAGLHKLRIDLGDFENSTRYAKYDNFDVAGESAKYQLSVGGYTGDAGDAFSYGNGMKFTTIDQDNDPWGGNCAVTYKGGWWYKVCHYCNLNGLYLDGDKTAFGEGINWLQWRGHTYSLKKTEMKIRPRQF